MAHFADFRSSDRKTEKNESCGDGVHTVSTRKNICLCAFKICVHLPTF
jgi:hypothetical protein